jgi:hypothetical protein
MNEPNLSPLQSRLIREAKLIRDSLSDRNRPRPTVADLQRRIRRRQKTNQVAAVVGSVSLGAAILLLLPSIRPTSSGEKSMATYPSSTGTSHREESVEQSEPSNWANAEQWSIEDIERKLDVTLSPDARARLKSLAVAGGVPVVVENSLADGQRIMVPAIVMPGATHPLQLDQLSPLHQRAIRAVLGKPARVDHGPT